MSQYVDVGKKAFTNGATALAQYLQVKLDTGVLALAGAADADYLGSLAVRAEANTPTTVLLRSKAGTRPVVASGAIAQGGDVFAAAGGKVAATGTVQLGIALDAAAADGDVIELLPL